MGFGFCGGMVNGGNWDYWDGIKGDYWMHDNGNGRRDESRLYIFIVLGLGLSGVVALVPFAGVVDNVI